ncbi:hypothetical protein V2J09_013778, partial [Rumex salicifolius]
FNLDETTEEKRRGRGHGLTHERLRDIKETFEHFDTDNSGYIDAKEMRIAIRELGSEMTEEQIEQLFADADDDGNGLLDFDEFCYIMTAKKIEKETKQQIKRAFDIIDRDNDVYLFSISH